MLKFRNYLLAACLFSMLAFGCKNEEEDQIPTEQAPDLCGESDNCDDGILDALVKVWQPVGGTFEGQDLTHGCVDSICPDFRLELMADASYRIEKTKVVQDSSTATSELTVETGTYLVKSCDCTQSGNSWEGYKMETDGEIQFKPSSGDAYQVNFQLFSGGVFLTASSQDSTFSMFIN